MQNNRIYVALVAIVAIGAIIFFAGTSRERSDFEDNQTADNDTPITITTEDAEGESGYEIDIIPSVEDTTAKTESLPTPPLLDRPIIFPGSFTDEEKNIIKNKIEELIAAIKENPSNVSAWIDLGLYRKAAEDYEGAAEAWEYAGLLSPKNSVSFHNLGELYGYYIHDNEKAESALLKAIKNGPNEVHIYVKTAEFYRDVVGDMEKARGIVQKGINNNPNSQDLKNLQKSLQE